MCWKIQMQKKRSLFFFSSWRGQASNSLQHSLWKPKQYLWWMQYSIYPDYGMFRMDRCMLVWAKLEARRCKSEDMCVCVCVLRKPHENMNKEICIIHCSGNHLTTSLRKRLFLPRAGKKKSLWVLEKVELLNQPDLKFNPAPQFLFCKWISLLFELGWVRLGAEINAVTM